MNFALVTTNLRGGGAEKSMLRLAAALAARGHRVRLVLLEHRVEHELPAGIELHALTAPGEAIGKGLLGQMLAAARLRALYRRLDLGGGCLTVSTLPFADRVVAAARLPNVWFRIANTLSAEIERLAPAKRARRLARYRRLYEGRNLVAVSDGVAADLRNALGLERARIVRIYGGFDLAALHAAAARPEPDLPRESFVLHVGRFMPQKRHDLLLDAWAAARLAHRLVLLTQPSPELEALIAARGVNDKVLVAGFRPNPYPWMRAAELLVLCSDREGMPNVLVEALACGTRVVSTDCPSGPREVLRGELARWLVPCGDAEALARTMRAALEAPRPGPDAVPPEFTAAHMARAYEALASHA
ncbi:MAG TPA: glycosyltransferase [Burkholderiales bacterium]|nr:glycosyltransferase [Burkholderiales bacterium]